MSDHVSGKTTIALPSRSEVREQTEVNLTAVPDDAGRIITLKYDNSHRAATYRVLQSRVGSEEKAVLLTQGADLPARGEMRIALTFEDLERGGEFEFELQIEPA
jgi:hypothetical protein